MKNGKFILAAAILGLSALSMPKRASAALAIVHTFDNGETKLLLANYTNNGENVALLAVNLSGHKISFAFKSDWETMRSLVKKAAAVDTKKWLEEGSMAETGTTDPSHLLIYVNETSLQFVITDPARGTHSFILPRSEVDEFMKQSAVVADALGSPAPDAPPAASK